MSDITNEELGRRRFQIQKEKAVEDAYEKIRRARGEQWETLSQQDREILHEILGDIWAGTSRTRWDSYAFSILSESDIASLIAVGKKIRNGQRTFGSAEKVLDGILNPKL